MTAAEVARTKVGAWEDLSPEIRADIKQAAIRQLSRRLDSLRVAAEAYPAMGIDGVVFRDMTDRLARLQRALDAAERL